MDKTWREGIRPGKPELRPLEATDITDTPIDLRRPPLSKNSPVYISGAALILAMASLFNSCEKREGNAERQHAIRPEERLRELVRLQENRNALMNELQAKNRMIAELNQKIVRQDQNGPEQFPPAEIIDAAAQNVIDIPLDAGIIADDHPLDAIHDLEQKIRDIDQRIRMLQQ